MKKIFTVIMALLTGAVSLSVLGQLIHGADAMRSLNKEEKENKRFFLIMSALLSGGVALSILGLHDA